MGNYPESWAALVKHDKLNGPTDKKMFEQGNSFFFLVSSKFTSHSFSYRDLIADDIYLCGLDTK